MMATNEEYDEKTIQRLKLFQTTITQKGEILEKLDEDILQVCEVETIEKEIEDSETYKMNLMQINDDITRKLHALQITSKPQGSQNNTEQQLHPQAKETVPTLPKPTFSDPPNSPLSTTTSTSTTTHVVHTKLPKISLPKFKGDVMHYRSFWDTFESSVHNNTGLNKIDKFNYLRSLLEGTALRAIDGLPITEDNYDAAIDILNKRFGQAQQLISAHMDELLKVQPCSTDKPSHLRYVYDKVSVNIRGLESLGIKSQQYGSMLIPIIMAKLPPQVRIQVARSAINEVWDIDELLELIRKEIEARELSEKIQTTEQKRPPTQAISNLKQTRNAPNTANTLVTSSSDVSKTPICVYCNERHFSASCEKVKDVEKRKTILKESRRCFNCLGKSHTAQDCTSVRKCRKCQGKHHQSICSHRQESNTQVSNAESSTTQMISNNQTVEKTPPTTTAAGACKGSVLLQTARAVATNGQRAINVRVLFDTGSQRSYITDDAKDKLQLEPIRTN